MEWDSPARPARQHEHNLALIARLTAAQGPVSRAQLAQRSGLTKTTVTQLTGELLDGGLLRELGTSRAGGPGRPANLLVVNSSGPAGIGLQIEADHVAGCLVDLPGRVRDRAIRRVDDLRGDPTRALKATEPVLRRLLYTAENTDHVVAGVAVGVPGGITGSMRVRSVELGWPETDLSRLLQNRLAALSGGTIPVTTHNGYQLAALAEHLFGRAGESGTALATPAARRDTETGSVLYVGGEFAIGVGMAGTGSGAVRATEFGHVRVRRGGERCGCGARGCLDTIAGHRALLRAAGVRATASSRLSGGEGPLPALVAAGDRPAVAAVRRAATAIGDALGGVVTLLGPDVVVLGGHLAALGRSFADVVGAELARRCAVHSVTVCPSRLGGDAVARAAATSQTWRLIDDPARWLAA